MKVQQLVSLSDLFYDATSVKKAGVREATAVIFLNGSQVLGVSRGKGGTWGTPGGKVDPGETPLEAAVREVKEETDISINKNNLKFIYQAMEGPFLVHCFLYTGKTPTRFKSSHEGDVQWISWQDLFDGPFGVNNRRLYLEIYGGC